MWHISITNKGLISKIRKQLILPNTHMHTHKTSNPIKKWTENLNIHSSKGEIQMTNSQMKSAQHC